MSGARASLRRALRGTPGVRRAAGAVRARRDVRRILASGIFERAWYELQSGRSFPDDAAAVRDYLARGRRAGLAPSPLFEPEWYDATGWRTDPKDPLLRYLDRPAQQRDVAPHPLFDPVAHRRSAPEATLHPGGPLGHFLGTARPEDPLPGAAVSWAAGRRRLERAVREWRDQECLREDSGKWSPATPRTAAPRRVGRVSAVVVTRDAPRVAGRCATALLHGAGDADIEVVLLDRASRRSNGVALAALELRDPRIRVLRIPVDLGYPLGVNTALPSTTGDVVAVCEPDIVVRPGWAAALTAALAGGASAVQALVLAPDGTIAAAGAAFPLGGGRVVPVLRGHPPEDVVTVGQVGVPALQGGLWAAPAADLLAVQGLDCRLTAGHATDLSLRLGDRRPEASTVLGPAAVAHRADGTDPAVDLDIPQLRERYGDRPAQGASLWRAAGLEVVAEEERVVVRRLPGSRRRWAVKTGAPAADGDARARRYARAVAAALCELGEHAVVDAREAWHRPTSRYDDVDLVLDFGEPGEPYRPVESRPALRWVVAPPATWGDRPADSDRFAAVLAAGATWADHAAVGIAERIEVLAAGADPALVAFADAEVDSPTADSPTADSPTADLAGRLLVAEDATGLPPAVWIAIEAGAPLVVHGRGWEPYVDAAVIGPPLDGPALAAAYRTASAVLVVHTQEERRGGFLRPEAFDVVACGGRVITDALPGVEALGAAARTWSDRPQLEKLLRELPWPPGPPGADVGLAPRVRRLIELISS